MPKGQGNGAGQGNGTGQGSINGGKGSGQGNRPGSGPGGNCVCPKCNTKVPHQRGTPCTAMACPKCGSTLIKE